MASTTTHRISDSPESLITDRFGNSVGGASCGVAGGPWGDDFNGDSFPPVGAPLTNAPAGVDSYGNARTISASASAPNVTVQINSGSSIGAYSHSQDSGVLGTSQTNYDLGGLDLTNGGSFNAFRIHVNAVDLSGNLGIIVDGETVLLSTTSVVFDVLGSLPAYADILFSDFVTADLTSASTISLLLDGSAVNAWDAQINSIETGVSLRTSSGGSGVT